MKRLYSIIAILFALVMAAPSMADTPRLLCEDLGTPQGLQIGSDFWFTGMRDSRSNRSLTTIYINIISMSNLVGASTPKNSVSYDQVTYTPSAMTTNQTWGDKIMAPELFELGGVYYLTWSQKFYPYSDNYDLDDLQMTCHYAIYNESTGAFGTPKRFYRSNSAYANSFYYPTNDGQTIERKRMRIDTHYFDEDQAMFYVYFSSGNKIAQAPLVQNADDTLELRVPVDAAADYTGGVQEAPAAFYDNSAYYMLFSQDHCKTTYHMRWKKASTLAGIGSQSGHLLSEVPVPVGGVYKWNSGHCGVVQYNGDVYVIYEVMSTTDGLGWTVDSSYNATCVGSGDKQWDVYIEKLEYKTDDTPYMLDLPSFCN